MKEKSRPSIVGAKPKDHEFLRKLFQPIYKENMSSVVQSFILATKYALENNDNDVDELKKYVIYFLSNYDYN